MADEKKKELAEEPVAPAAPEGESIDEVKAQLAAALEQVAALQAALDAAQAAPAEGETAKMAEVRKMAESTARSLAAVQAELAGEKLNRDLDGYEAKGYFAPARRQYMAELAGASRKLFLAEVKRLEANPEIDLSERGVPGDPPTVVALTEDERHDAEIRKLSESKKITYTQAWVEYRAAHKKAGK